MRNVLIIVYILFILFLFTTRIYDEGRAHLSRAMLLIIIRMQLNIITRKYNFVP